MRPNVLLDGNFLAGSLGVQAVSERRRLQGSPSASPQHT
jgi:hypothetical protein